ncbi:mechanosensitive ion channel domain-containing protein [Magnetospirillum sp. 64-120]|uniref:mechanosensitive ion channel domain-containing protein n=1 Tax=Magnetospirillum sp. 64-120 TaxID=1895778 RepID=UPI0025C4C689|nr:mechanosensitive ion channel domain-containing protein [Magnetospirillum sp. 64-120]
MSAAGMVLGRLSWRLGPPMVLIGVLAMAHLRWDSWLANAISSVVVRDSVSNLLEILRWAAAAWLLNRLASVFLWPLVARRSGSPVPKMAADLVALLVWLGTGLTMAVVVFDQSPTALLATSTVALGVVGFAVRELISDFFAGISLSIERPFAIGDWIEVDRVSGKVVDMTWRAVRLMTTDDVTIIVPNGNIAAETFRNYSRPDNWFRDELKVPLPFEVTTHQGSRILLSAVTQIPELAAFHKKPSVSIDGYDERGVIWRLLYWVPDFGRLSPIRFAVHANILRNLHMSGLRVPVPIEEIRVMRTPLGVEVSSIQRMLKSSPVFSALDDDDLAILAEGATQRVAPMGKPILHQGEPGSSLFLLNEGLLAVSVTGADGVMAQVGQIAPGHVFGEMSLLTGAPRGATVVPALDCLITEIGKDCMAQLLDSRPQLAESLSRILAERQGQNSARMVAENAEAGAGDDLGAARAMLGRIRSFFNMPG